MRKIIIVLCLAVVVAQVSAKPTFDLVASYLPKPLADQLAMVNAAIRTVIFPNSLRGKPSQAERADMLNKMAASKTTRWH